MVDLDEVAAKVNSRQQRFIIFNNIYIEQVKVQYMYDIGVVISSQLNNLTLQSSQYIIQHFCSIRFTKDPQILFCMHVDIHASLKCVCPLLWSSNPDVPQITIYEHCFHIHDHNKSAPAYCGTQRWCEDVEFCFRANIRCDVSLALPCAHADWCST